MLLGQTLENKYILIKNENLAYTSKEFDKILISKVFENKGKRKRYYKKRKGQHERTNKSN